MTLLGLFAFGLFCVGVGVLCVLGAIRRWKWLVDPPEELWLNYSQSFIKKMWGAEVARSYIMCFGVACLIAGAGIVTLAV